MFEFSLFKPTFGLDFGFFAKQALSWVELELFIKLRHQPTANRYHGFKEPVVAAKPAITFLWSNLGTDQPKHKISICYSPLPIMYCLTTPTSFDQKVRSLPTFSFYTLRIQKLSLFLVHQQHLPSSPTQSTKSQMITQLYKDIFAFNMLIKQL